MMPSLDIEHLLIAGGVATAIAAIYALIRLLSPGVGKIMSSIAKKVVDLSNYREVDREEHRQIFKLLENLGTLIEEVRLEFHPNGGTSVKDILNKIANRQAYLSAFQMSSIHTWEKAIFLTDSSGACVYVNRAHSRLTGFRPDECMGYGWINIVAPDERDEISHAWEEAVRQDITFDKVMTYVEPGNINPYKVKVHAVKIQEHDASEDVFGYMGEVVKFSAENQQ